MGALSYLGVPQEGHSVSGSIGSFQSRESKGRKHGFRGQLRQSRGRNLCAFLFKFAGSKESKAVRSRAHLSYFELGGAGSSLTRMMPLSTT